MKRYELGDTTTASCNNCESFQNVTYQLRDVKFSDESGSVKDVLVGVCDTCDLVIVLPHQSVPAVKVKFDQRSS